MTQLPTRYELIRQLGEGGMGQVFLVADREAGNRVALKTLRPQAGATASSQAEALYLFKQEFWAMASLRHANLVAGYDFGELPDGTPYFTMEAVPGQDLAIDRVHDEASVRTWLPGIAAALAFLHARGYVHGDLKPENVRLGDDGTTRLMDLGLLSRAGKAHGAVRGSLAYMAPEQARQMPLDARTDLYGLGAVLYHALSGRTLFDPDGKWSAIEVLKAQIDTRPDPLREVAPGVSAELAGAVMRLLEKDPARRYASAQNFLAAIGLEAAGEEAIGLLSAPIIGRDAITAELNRCPVWEAKEAVWLLGAAGMGKTRLASEIRAEAQLENLQTYVAQGMGVEAPPYQALRPWLLALAGTPAAKTEKLAAVMIRLLPEFGRLAGLPNLTPAPALEGAQEKMRLHATVAELALAAAPRALWIVDDADALDATSTELVVFLGARAGENDWHWLFTANQLPAGIKAQAPLELEAFSPATTLDLAATLLGQVGQPLPAAVADRLPDLAGGSPGVAEAILGHWVRTGALQRVAGAWTVPNPNDLELPGGIAMALDSRFAALDANAKQVGHAAAILGTTGALPLLSKLVGMPEADFFASLSALEAADVLVREDSAYRFNRPAQAEALVAALPEAEARRLHGLAAGLREAGCAGAGEAAVPLAELMAIAHHHLASETPLAGAVWAVRAARRAMALYTHHAVAPLVRKALAVTDLEPTVRLDLLVMQVDIHRHQGQVDEAQALMENEVLPTARERAKTELPAYLITLGLLHQMKGRYPKALEAYNEAVSLADAANNLQEAVRGRMCVGRTAFFAGDTATARETLAKAVEMGRTLGPSGMLAAVLSISGYIVATTEPQDPVRGLAMLGEAIALNAEVDNLYELQDTYNNQGNIFLAAGRLADAKRAFGQCLALCERMATPNELIFANLNLGAVQLELGYLADAAAHARKAGDMARLQGRKFPEAFTRALEGLAAIHMGDLVGGTTHLDEGLRLAREIQNRYLELNVLAYRVEALLHLGRFDAALEDLAKARELATATGNDEHAIRLNRAEAALAVLSDAPEAAQMVLAVLNTARTGEQPVAIAHALRWQIERLLRESNVDGALTLMMEAASLAEDAGLLLLGAELREIWGRLLASLDPNLAADRFAQGRELARQSGSVLVEILCQAGLTAAVPEARLDASEAPRRLQSLIEPLSEAERQAYLAWPERAATVKAGMERMDTVSAERLRHLTDLIAMVTSQPDLPQVMHQALSALIDIAGAERGFLLIYNGFEVVQRVFIGMDESEGDEFSSSLAYQVLWSGEPLFVEDASSHTEFMGRESIQALSLRSVVAVPLNDGVETIGVMMADSQRINARFGADDLDWAMALARQVAIAITNTRRLEKYQNAFDEAQVLHRVALGMLGQRTLEGALVAVAAEALPLCGASRAVFIDADSLLVRAAFDAEGNMLEPESIAISTTVRDWVATSSEPLHLVDAQNDEDFAGRASVMALGLRTVFAVPVTFGDVQMGVLYLDHPQIVDENPIALHTLKKIGEMMGAFVLGGS